MSKKKLRGAKGRACFLFFSFSSDATAVLVFYWQWIQPVKIVSENPLVFLARGEEAHGAGTLTL